MFSENNNMGRGESCLVARVKGVTGDCGGQIGESIEGPSSLLQRPELPLCVYEPHFSETRRRRKKCRTWGSRGMKEGEERLESVGERWRGRCCGCPVRSAHSCLPSSTAPPVKRALSGERIHFSVETPHTQSSESCSYATSRYLLPVSPINYSPKYRSQGKETPRMGQQDRAELSQLNERGQIKKRWVVGWRRGRGGGKLCCLFLLSQPTEGVSISSSSANVLESCSYNVPTLS